MQEGPLFSNDLKTGSISTKFFSSEAGDRPLSTPSSTESVCAGDSLDTEALGASLPGRLLRTPPGRPRRGGGSVTPSETREKFLQDYARIGSSGDQWPQAAPRRGCAGSARPQSMLQCSATPSFSGFFLP